MTILSINQKNDFYWKIDYYDKNYEYGSEDPTDSSVTNRVLTVMLAEERLNLQKQMDRFYDLYMDEQISKGGFGRKGRQTTIKPV